MRAFGLLPLELVHHILHFLAADDPRRWSASPVVPELTQVCRYWRGCAISYPPLWSCIRLEDARRIIRQSWRRAYTRFDRHHLREERLVMMYVFRCQGALQLEISSTAGVTTHGIYTTHRLGFLDVVQFVLTFSHRLKSLRIELDSHSAAHSPFLPLRGPFPNIEHLSLEDSDRGPLTRTSSQPIGPAAALRPTSVFIDHAFRLQPYSMGSSLDASRLAHLRVALHPRDFDYNNLHGLLLHAPNLVALSVETVGHHPVYPRAISCPSFSHRVVLPQLHHMEFQGVWSFLPTVVDLSHSPRLHHLSLRDLQRVTRAEHRSYRISQARRSEVHTLLPLLEPMQSLRSIEFPQLQCRYPTQNLAPVLATTPCVVVVALPLQLLLLTDYPIQLDAYHLPALRYLLVSNANFDLQAKTSTGANRFIDADALSVIFHVLLRSHPHVEIHIFCLEYSAYEETLNAIDPKRIRLVPAVDTVAVRDAPHRFTLVDFVRAHDMGDREFIERHMYIPYD